MLNPFLHIELAVFPGLGDELAQVLVMMTSTALPQQSMSIVRGNSLVAGTMQWLGRLQNEMEEQSSVRPSVILVTAGACFAAWGIASILIWIG
jgi:hypothetical protein